MNEAKSPDMAKAMDLREVYDQAPPAPRTEQATTDLLVALAALLLVQPDPESSQSKAHRVQEAIESAHLLIARLDDEQPPACNGSTRGTGIDAGKEGPGKRTGRKTKGLTEPARPAPSSTAASPNPAAATGMKPTRRADDAAAKRRLARLLGAEPFS
ncbi:MAG: hypothetical protein HY814_01855 [Candidatus Riflebacteria bacterium]|nr:hypothetical protein [Candidatus Riflebacteria bacterium]